MRKIRNLGAVLGAAVVIPASATASTGTPIDTAEIVAQFGQIETALGAVGAVILAAAALAVGFKWIKGMVFS